MPVQYFYEPENFFRRHPEGFAEIHGYAGAEYCGIKGIRYGGHVVAYVYEAVEVMDVHRSDPGRMSAYGCADLVVYDRAGDACHPDFPALHPESELEIFLSVEEFFRKDKSRGNAYDVEKQIRRLREEQN